MAQVKVDQLEAGSPTVLTYEISDEKLKTLNIRRFENYSEEWARFILMNRNNPVDVPAHDYDIVIGLQTLVRNLQYMKGITIQYFFGTERAVNLLHRI